MNFILSLHSSFIETTLLGQGAAWSAGDQISASRITSLCHERRLPSHETLTEAFLRQEGSFAVVVDTPGYLLAGVDCVRSIPLFWSESESTPLCLSDSARLAAEALRSITPEQDCLLEARMAGYVTGDQTLIAGLRQIPAGEYLLFDKARNTLKRNYYYRYLPQEPQKAQRSVLLDELGRCIDSAFGRVIDRADGRPLVVPLSGGLDSRLVACKLRELGYPNIRAFSYGMPGNQESATAKRVAAALDIPWIDVPSKRKRARSIGQSELLKRYSDFADGLCVLPSIAEIEGVSGLRELNLMPDDAIVVNGQSGDFLTGGHIPQCCRAPGATIEAVVTHILRRHFNLWTHLTTPENLEIVGRRVLEVLSQYLDESPTQQSLAAAYECWEWRERQAKLVVGGQRLYEFFGLGWELPLWDFDLMRFYQGVPLAWRDGQDLFLDYLKRYDFLSVFSSIPRPGYGYFGSNRFWMPYFLKGSSLLFGRFGEKWSDKFTAYFHHYGHLYALLGARRFLARVGQASVPPHSRGVTAIFCERWLEELGFI